MSTSLLNFLKVLAGIIIGIGGTYFYYLKFNPAAFSKYNNSQLVHSKQIEYDIRKSNAFIIPAPKGEFVNIGASAGDKMRTNYLNPSSPHLMIKYLDANSASGYQTAIYEGCVIDTLSIREILNLHPTGGIFIAIGVKPDPVEPNDNNVYTNILYGISKGDATHKSSLMRGVNDVVEDYTTPCPPCALQR